MGEGFVELLLAEAAAALAVGRLVKQRAHALIESVNHPERRPLNESAHGDGPWNLSEGEQRRAKTELIGPAECADAVERGADAVGRLANDVRVLVNGVHRIGISRLDVFRCRLPCPLAVLLGRRFTLSEGRREGRHPEATVAAAEGNGQRRFP